MRTDDGVGAGDIGFNVVNHVGINNLAGNSDRVLDRVTRTGTVRFEDIAAQSK